MKRINKCYMLAVIAFFYLGNAHASLKDAARVYRSGNWTVVRSIDPMKDSVTCTGIYRDNYGIQLTDNAFYVTVKGGIQSVTLRFGEAQARSLRLPAKMEKEIGSVIIDGVDFSELVESGRLRLQAVTLVRGMANEDIDLTGIKLALENIKSGCPVLKEEAKPMASAPGPAVSVCSPELKAKMKLQGIKQKQISAVCDD